MWRNYMEDRHLYRAKRLDNGEWEIGSLIVLPNGDYEIGNKCKNPPDSDPMWNNSLITHKVDPSTVCQCTGLRDKNGQNIWENDVVKYTDMVTCAEKIDHIEWNETHASFVRLHKSEKELQYLNIDEFIANGCEVIGSAIDNPKLLEVGE